MNALPSMLWRKEMHWSCLLQRWRSPLSTARPVLPNPMFWFMFCVFNQNPISWIMFLWMEMHWRPPIVQTKAPIKKGITSSKWRSGAVLNAICWFIFCIYIVCSISWFMFSTKNALLPGYQLQQRRWLCVGDGPFNQPLLSQRERCCQLRKIDTAMG